MTACRGALVDGGSAASVLTMDNSAQQPASSSDDVIGDVRYLVEPRRRVPSTSRQTAAQLATAAAAVANSYRFTVGHDEAFPLPPSPLAKPKNSSSGQCQAPRNISVNVGEIKRGRVPQIIVVSYVRIELLKYAYSSSEIKYVSYTFGTAHRYSYRPMPQI